MKLAYLGDGNNVAHSLPITGAIPLGTDGTVVSPKGSGPDAQIFNLAAELARQSGAKLAVTDNCADIRGFDVAYTDTWVSMGDITARWTQ